MADDVQRTNQRRRLYNKYDAAPCEGNVKRIDQIVSMAALRVWHDIVEAYDVCPRDAEAICHQTLSGVFAENILRRAMERRRRERAERDARKQAEPAVEEASAVDLASRYIGSLGMSGGINPGYVMGLARDLDRERQQSRELRKKYRLPEEAE